MSPPDDVISLDWEELDNAIEFRRRQRARRNRVAFRRAVKITVIPILLAIACYFAVKGAIHRVIEVQTQKAAIHSLP